MAEKSDSPASSSGDGEGRVPGVFPDATQILRYQWKWFYWISEASPMNDIGVFSDWGRFWSVFNLLIKPSSMPINSKYYLFKSHIVPIPQHPHNSGGGAWSCTIPRSSGSMDAIWTSLILMLINGNLEDLDSHICGAEFEFTQALPRVSIWVKDVADYDNVMKIGRAMKENVLVPTGLGHLRPLFIPHLPAGSDPLYMVS